LRLLGNITTAPGTPQQTTSYRLMGYLQTLAEGVWGWNVTGCFRPPVFCKPFDTSNIPCCCCCCCYLTQTGTNQATEIRSSELETRCLGQGESLPAPTLACTLWVGRAGEEQTETQQTVLRGARQINVPGIGTVPEAWKSRVDTCLLLLLL
jgi:hypothetical protein